MTHGNRRRELVRERRSLRLEWLFARQNRPRPRAGENRRPLTAIPTAHASVQYLLTLIAIVVIVAAAFALHLSIRFEGVQLGYAVSQARTERTRLLAETRALRLELASLKAPASVETEARERLGMEVPDHFRIIPIGGSAKTFLASGGAH